MFAWLTVNLVALSILAVAFGPVWSGADTLVNGNGWSLLANVSLSPGGAGTRPAGLSSQNGSTWTVFLFRCYGDFTFWIGDNYAPMANHSLCTSMAATVAQCPATPAAGYGYPINTLFTVDANAVAAMVDILLEFNQSGRSAVPALTGDLNAALSGDGKTLSLDWPVTGQAGDSYSIWWTSGIPEPPVRVDTACGVRLSMQPYVGETQMQSSGGREYATIQGLTPKAVTSWTVMVSRAGGYETVFRLFHVNGAESLSVSLALIVIVLLVSVLL